MTNESRFRSIFKDDKLEDLYQLYYTVDKEVEASKGRRILLVFVGFIIVTFAITLSVMRATDSINILSCVVIAVVVGGGAFFVNFSIFQWLISKNRIDHERRENIKLRIELAQEREEESRR